VSGAGLLGTPRPTCGTSFLLLFVFLISLIHHRHPALLHRHTLILDHLLTFLVAFSILVLKLFFTLLEVFPFITVFPFLRADLELRSLVVSQSLVV